MTDGVFDEDGNILPLKHGARWAIGRAGINFIEGSPVDHDDDPVRALALLHLPVAPAILDEYFPAGLSGKRCPTFALMRLWYAYGGNQNRTGGALV